jgi:8-oxo-dGTP pyrophosphatase MutT (NUDIX family)
MKTKLHIAKEDRSTEENFIVDGLNSRQRVEAICIGPENTLLACSAKHNGYIELPGGGTDKGETAIQAALREVREETGWSVIDAELFTQYGDFVYPAEEGSWLKKNGYDQETNVYVTCKALRFDPDSIFGSQGDAQRYELLSLDQVIHECMCTIRENKDARGVHICRSRLEVLRYLFAPTVHGVPTYQLPKYAAW